ncbi:glyoxal reductase-like [Ornithodoros turicata]|uniref:glyoxal reductase-like n=1 Tax=Ornithodoros turicata TaxID=34597 RepID=UPI0031396579
MSLSACSRLLLNNGVSLPIIGLGTYRIQCNVLQHLLKTATQCGYRLIDTAPGYKNEEVLKQFLSELPQFGLQRSEIFISSKLSPADHGTGKCRTAATDILKRLSIEKLDLLLIHWPGARGLKLSDPKHAELRRESWLELEQMYKEGKFASIGVSNYTVKHLKELLTYCSVKPTVNQVEFHPHLVQEELLNFCKDNGIVLQAYSSLGAADGVSAILNEPVLIDIAKQHNKTVAQVTLRWALQLGVGIIPKSSNAKRIKENAQLFDFELSAEQVSAISKLNKGKHYCWDPSGIP